MLFRLGQSFLGAYYFYAMQRQPLCPLAVFISFSTVCLVVLGCLLFSFHSTLDVLIVQYKTARVSTRSAGIPGFFALAKTEANNSDKNPSG